MPYGRVGYTKMAFAQVAKGYLSTIANKNSFSLITNMRVASVSTALKIANNALLVSFAGIIFYEFLENHKLKPRKISLYLLLVYRK